MMQEMVLFRWLLVIVFPEQVGFVQNAIMCDVSHRKFGMELIYTVTQFFTQAVAAWVSFQDVLLTFREGFLHKLFAFIYTVSVVVAKWAGYCSCIKCLYSLR